MMIVNRFVELAQNFQDHEIPIDRVFRGAEFSESDSVVEAMYVIADRRAKSGKPVLISEITDGIPELVENQSVLDAAIDICLDGLISKGHTQDSAYDILLQSTASVLKKVDLEESADISAFIEHSAIKAPRQVRQLPAGFGIKDMDGRMRYELRRVLGSGSHGTMYEGVDRVFAEDGHPSLVAVKIAHDEVDEQRSKLEGARARRVRHKNVARVHDCGIAVNGESYVTYEYIDGLPLDSWVKNRQRPLSLDEACLIVGKLADGVQAAHNAGVIHRDLKPSNILMSRDNEPIITDFGIAHTSTSDPRLCSFYGTRGSLAFMAPEQYHGGTDGVMPSVDTYALGGLLYWLLTGKFPNGQTVSDALTRLEIRNEGGEERPYGPHIDQRMGRIVERALSANLSDRYNSAASLALDLDSYLIKRPIPWLDNTWMIKSSLFAKRNPMTVVLYLVFTGLIGVSAAAWVSSKSQIRLEQNQSAAALVVQQTESKAVLEQERLNSQIELEQDRVRQLSERNLMAKNMLVAWSRAADNRNDEVLATANLLFLYTVSTSGFLDGDPEMADKLLNQRVQIAEEYLATLTPLNSSPIKRAQWHEMLGAWYLEQGEVQGVLHLDEAKALVGTFAPEDTIWMNRLSELGSN